MRISCMVQLHCCLDNASICLLLGNIIFNEIRCVFQIVFVVFYFERLALKLKYVDANNSPMTVTFE